MTRPRRNTVLCRGLAAASSALARSRRPPLEAEANEPSGSDSDGEIGAPDIFEDEVPEACIQTALGWTENTPGASVDTDLVWKEGAGSSLRSVYSGKSIRTFFRKEKAKRQRHNSVKNDPKIWNFLPKKRTSEPDPNEATSPAATAIEKLTAEINLTPSVLVEKQTRNTTKWDFIRKLAVRHYLQSMLKEEPKVESSEKIASLLLSDRNVVHSGRLIRQWAQYLVHNGVLPVHQQGKFVKKQSLVHDEDIQLMLRNFIRNEPDVSLTSSKLASWVNENLHVKLGLESSVNISSRTGQRWLNILGLRFGKFMKGLYNDGHERDDVVRYRIGFLERMAVNERRMIQYVGDFMETKISPDLEQGTRPLILVTHDESCFGCNDGRSFCWLDDDNRQIRPKGNGRSVMVSAFLCECHGILRLDDELRTQHPDIAADSTVFLKPGVNCEGYWKNSDLIEQVKEKAIPIFNLLHQDCDALFMFDNSQNHHARPPDALIASRMNLSNGGVNQRLMRDGWYLNENGDRVEQKMVLEDDPLKSKGVRQVLQERGLWDSSMNVKEARNLLSKQKDFAEQKEWLEETLLEAGFAVDFYPKYHCEFNYIEMFWGAAKAWSRAHCTFNFNDHVLLVPKALDSVSLSKIRKFARKSYRYMDAYRLTGSGGNTLT
jgi:hypothetical protein